MKKFGIAMAAAALMLGGCGGGGEEAEGEGSSGGESVGLSHEGAVTSTDVTGGQQVYADFCSGCHQDGQLFCASWWPATSASPRSPAAGSTSSTSPRCVVELVARENGAGCGVTAGSLPSPLHPHRRTAPHLRLELQDEPPSADLERRRGGDRRPGRRHHRDPLDRPRPPRPREEDAQLLTVSFGIVGLETLIPITVKGLIEPGHLTWPQVIRYLTVNPAQLLGIPKGTLSRASTPT